MTDDQGQVAPATTLGTACCSCLLRHACPPCGLAGLHGQHQVPLVFSRQRLQSGQTLFRKGDAFGLVHAVRTGSLKSSLTLADGRTQVSSFHLPGDVLGLEGMANGRHQTTATALEDTQTCALACGPMLELALCLPLVQQDLARLMSREACAAQWHMLLLGSMSAPERMAALLLDLSRRAAARGHSPSEFKLRMTRSDIGSYLGITAETVCRVLQGFKALKLLEVDTRQIRFLDLPTFAHTYSATVLWRPGTNGSGPAAVRTPRQAEQTRLTPP